MPVTTRRSRSNLRPNPNPSSQNTNNNADHTLTSDKIIRQRRSKVSPSPSPSPSPFPPQTIDTPSPYTDILDSTATSRASSVTTATMFSREQSNTLRGRNVEDTLELEEKGLLMRKTPSRGGSRENSPEGKRSSSKGKSKEIRMVDHLVTEDEGSHGGGLNNKRDREAFALLVVLYLLQGVPLGLTFGTLPFLLKPHLSYSQLAIFALSTWPYSLKLLWSPIVDAWFLPKCGRRKSWIVPVQTIVGVGLWIIGGKVNGWLAADTVNIHFLTCVFGSLILAAATQDIAVDGWALTLLSQQNLSYASTAQTIGLGIGSALAFTVFLAFNSPDFSSEPLPHGLISLGGYMRFWGLMFFAVTLWLALMKKEDPVSEDDPDMDVKKVYKIMWSIVQLKSGSMLLKSTQGIDRLDVRSFLVVHLICKIGWQVNEAVTSLKLIEKGLSKEDMAVAVLLDFPAQMIAGWLAAKWSRPTPTSRHPLSNGSANGVAGGAGQVLRPWIMAFWARLGMALVAVAVVKGFPSDGKVGTGYFTLIILMTLLSSLASTVQFVGITAFHTQIADPLIGGSYMTLLNTVSNLGGTWPKPLVLRGVDFFTRATCTVTLNHLGKKTTGSLGECVSESGKLTCTKENGVCEVATDGYYFMSLSCVAMGTVLFIWYILPTVKRLQSLPMNAWRVKIPN